MLALLRRRDFALLWLGGLVSVTGDWVLRAALPYFVYERTGSTVATAGMIAAALAPGIVLGSVAGVFVDRWNRKRVLVAGNLLQAGTVALLLLVPHEGWLWVVFAVAAAQSLIGSFSSPAESALLPTLVGDEQLVAANALNVVNNRIGRLLGVPLGATLLAALGLELVVVVDAASFVLAALLVSPIVAPPSARVLRAAAGAVSAAAGSAWTAFWGEWLDGLRLVGRERVLAVVFGVLGLMTFGGTMLDPLTVAWVRDVLGEGPQVYALLLTAHAASGIAGAVLVSRIDVRLAPRLLVGWSSIAAGIALAVRYNVPSVPLALGLSLFVGLTSVASAVGVETLVQRAVRDDYRGRVFGALGATGSLLSLLGALTAGVLAEVVGLVTMLNVASALIALAGLVVLRAFSPTAAAASAEQALASARCTPP
ncbi:MAG TPA: MFS transporter [Gaiellaceae bacterium]|nr:MFS transporter [Gaiellaceae bacterium]